MDKGPLRHLPTWGSLGLGGISLAFPYLFKSLPDWVTWPMFFLGLGILCASCYPLFLPLLRKIFPEKFPAHLISFTEFLRHIETTYKSWAASENFIPELDKGLRDAGYDESLHFRGRSQKSGNDDATRRATLEDIPREHWKDFQISFIDVFAWTNKGAVSAVQTDNLRAYTYVPGHLERKRESYADIHLVRAEALAWLKLNKPA